MIQKFSLQALLLNEEELRLYDESGTEIDADVFDELLKSGVRNFKVGYRQHQTTGKGWDIENNQSSLRLICMH